MYKRIHGCYLHGNKCKCTTISDLTINNHVTFGAVPSLTDSEGILGIEGFKSSTSLSALLNRKENVSK